MDSSVTAVARRLPVGAETSAVPAGVHFRVWAPNTKSVHVVLEDGDALSESPYAGGTGRVLLCVRA